MMPLYLGEHPFAAHEGVIAAIDHDRRETDDRPGITGEPLPAHGVRRCDAQWDLARIRTGGWISIGLRAGSKPGSDAATVMPVKRTACPATETVKPSSFCVSWPPAGTSTAWSRGSHKVSAVGTVAGAAGVALGLPVSRGRHAGATAAGAHAIQGRQRGGGQCLLIQPTSLVIERRHRRSVEDHRVDHATDQGSLVPHRLRTGLETNCTTEHLAHHFEGHRCRLLEHAQLAIRRRVGVGVLRVESDLDGHSSPAPPREGLPAARSRRPRPRSADGVSGTRGWPEACWGQAVVVQQRGDGDRGLVHGARLGDVSEVDDGMG